jgi:hypothetical protein
MSRNGTMTKNVSSQVSVLTVGVISELPSMCDILFQVNALRVSLEV